VTIPTKELSIDLTEMETSKGSWLIAVENVVKTQADGNLLLKIVLEQGTDEEHFRSRELGMLLPLRRAVDPDHCPSLISQIRGWIDSTEGDGFVDLTRRPAGAPLCPPLVLSNAAPVL
jgi:hypothetical protein